jgi:hypothetical protein
MANNKLDKKEISRLSSGRDSNSNKNESLCLFFSPFNIHMRARVRANE